MANFIGWSRSLTSKNSALIAFKHPCFDICDGLPQLERLLVCQRGRKAETRTAACGRVRREAAQVKQMPGGEGRGGQPWNLQGR